MTVLDNVVRTCVLCRKAVAVAINKREITALNAEARPFIPTFLLTIFDTGLFLYRNEDSSVENEDSALKKMRWFWGDHSPAGLGALT